MKKKTGFHEPSSTRNMEPGFKKLPVPGHDDLRPGQRDESTKYGAGRSMLNFADGNRMVHDFGSPPGWPAQSPASAQYTPGLRKNPKEGETDPAAATIQPGIPRVR
jgi:hypothetical protein